MNQFKFMAVAAVLLTTGPAQASETSFTAKGQIRHRFEVDNRDFGRADARTYGLLRSRLDLQFVPSENVTALIQVQDSRTMGEETNTLNDGSADNIDFHQAYVQIRRVFNLPVDAKMGRMELNLGGQRLVGAVDWHNVGRSFDGVVARVSESGSTTMADLFYFTEKEGLQAGDNGDRRIIGFHGETVPWTGEVVQPFLIWQREVPSDMLNRYTIGFRATGSNSGFKHELEFAYQGGDITRSTKMDVKAWMGAANVSYEIPGASTKTELSAGVDLLSGDDGTEPGTTKTFDTLYATNHKFYGFMDYFLNLPADTYGGGLMDVHGGIGVKASKKTGLSGMYHLFRAAEDVGVGGGETSTDFGHEVDVTLNHAYNDVVKMTAGASVFLPGTIFKEKRGDDTSTWFYLMTTVNL